MRFTRRHDLIRCLLLATLVCGTLLVAAQPAMGQAPSATEPGWMDRIDQAFGQIIGHLVSVFFYDFGTKSWLGASIPLVVAWLFFGALFFTTRMSFVNVRAFRHAINVTAGRFDNPADRGEVSHFQALSSAVSATVGLGNIAGVAIAVCMGGPGAIFWMIIAGLLGMSSKFTECSLGQMYRKIAPDGRVSGGAMHYLEDGLSELGLRPLGKVLAILFAIMCIGGSFGGGNAFQVTQSLRAIDVIGIELGMGSLFELRWVYGLVMAFFVGIVIIGGIRRIAATAEKIVPLMCVLYVLACIYILATHYEHILPGLSQILTEALSPGGRIKAMTGGAIGVIVVGIQRAAFSNEAGIGSAAIAHSAARTEEPIREGIVALLEPFLDTVIICTMTGLVIVISGVYAEPANQHLVEAREGAALTAKAFGSVVIWFPFMLAAAVLLFAYSTMITWSYYGERCWAYLFGARTSIVYRLLYLGFVMIGAIVTSDNILAFGDMMILAMAFPNILGVVLLSGKVRRSLDAYWRKYRTGQFPVYK